MTQTIAVVAPGVPAEDLADVLRPLEGRGIALQTPQPGGLALDPATMQLAFELAKVTLPALISAVAVVWAAKVAKSGSPAHTPPPSAHPRLVLELDTGDVSVDLDWSGQPLVPLEGPRSAADVLRIRLER